jgi:hypothetical protein
MRRLLFSRRCLVLVLALASRLFNSDGTLNESMWAKLTQILDLAHQKNLVVDLTMDNVSGPCTITDTNVPGGVLPVMCPNEYQIAIGRVTDRLRDAGVGHVMFDLGNERNLDNRATYISAADVQTIRNYVSGTLRTAWAGCTSPAAAPAPAMAPSATPSIRILPHRLAAAPSPWRQALHGHAGRHAAADADVARL